jgi:hypothetical protein
MEEYIKNILKYILYIYIHTCMYIYKYEKEAMPLSEMKEAVLYWITIVGDERVNERTVLVLVTCW